MDDNSNNNININIDININIKMITKNNQGGEACVMGACLLGGSKNTRKLYFR